MRELVLDKVVNVLGIEANGQNPENIGFIQKFDLSYRSNMASLLQCHYWSFATKFAVLEEDVNTEGIFFSKKFKLPADFAAKVYVNPTGQAFLDVIPYQITSDSLYTDFNKVYMCYTRDFINSQDLFSPEKATPLFRDALALRIARDLCLPHTQDRDLLAILHSQYKDLKMESIDVEMRNRGDLNNYNPTDLTDARRHPYATGFQSPEEIGNNLNLTVTPLAGRKVTL